MRKSYLILNILLISLGAFANRSREDKAIANSLLSNFKEECSHLSNKDRIILENLQQQLELARNEKNKLAESCIQEQFSQMSGIHFIYKRLCDELTFRGIPDNEVIVNRLLVSSQKYKKGLKPFFTNINDCFRDNKVPDHYHIDLSKSQADHSPIYRSLEKLKVDLPFRPNRIDFR